MVRVALNSRGPFSWSILDANGNHTPHMRSCNVKMQCHTFQSDIVCVAFATARRIIVRASREIHSVYAFVLERFLHTRTYRPAFVCLRALERVFCVYVCVCFVVNTFHILTHARMHMQQASKQHQRCCFVAASEAEHRASSIGIIYPPIQRDV